MKCQILLVGKTKKVSSNILSADIIQRVVKVRGTSNILLHRATFYLKMTFFVEKKTHETRQSVWSIL